MNKTLSMDEKVIKKGEARGKELGYTTFSAYITYLILKDCGELAITLDEQKK